MMEEEKNNVENSAEPTGDQAVDLQSSGDQAADLQSSGDQAADAQSSAVVPLQPDKPLSGKELRRQKKKPLQRKRLKLPHRKHGKSRGRSAEGTPEGGIARCEAAAPPGEKRIPAGRPPGTRTGNKTALAYRGIHHACDVYCACD